MHSGHCQYFEAANFNDFIGFTRPFQRSFLGCGSTLPKGNDDHFSGELFGSLTHVIKTVSIVSFSQDLSIHKNVQSARAEEVLPGDGARACRDETLASRPVASLRRLVLSSPPD